MTATSPETYRAPALFLPHGGGPMPLLNDAGHRDLITFLTKTGRKYLNPRPKAILLVTAHWETRNPTVSTVSNPELLYDYYNFPPETYNIDFPAKGDPKVAKRVVDLLQNAGFKTQTDAERGWDHGVFVPLKLYLPDFDIPIIPMSVLTSQDAAEHYRIGKALEPLRDEGVMIIGSGMSFHNMRAMRGRLGFSGTLNEPFDDAVDEAVKIASSDERGKVLSAWDKMEGALDSHPSGAAEHFMPLLVVAGAGGDESGIRALTWNTSPFRISAWVWEGATKVTA
ncbi:hypothetical protein SpCBS45565_g06107 [Spizellomyces sp. 'palustris']|nr:hypothetical protein SpCBS45565_g06107 [Spizellomyces sp. 'palustris']